MIVPTQLLTEAYPQDPALDMALSGALLESVAIGDHPNVIRVFRPGPTVAFGRLDRLRSGFSAACEVALAHGRTPLLRLGGGHAAAYDDDCILLETIKRHSGIVTGLEQRFRDCVDLLQRALDREGIGSVLGELPGEYCAGRFSLHLLDGPKIAGVAQRIISGAALTTAVLVVDGGPSLRTIIGEVYNALGLPVEADAAGAVSDQRSDVSVESVFGRVLEVVRAHHRAEPASLHGDLVERAARLVHRCRPLG